MIQIIKNKRSEGKIKTHYGMTDYYKSFKQKNPELDISKTIYDKVIGDFNKAIIDLVIEDTIEYKIPHLGCILSVRKVKSEPRIVDGKVITRKPVDWITTNKLWSEDKDAADKKILVRYNNPHTSGYIFKIYLKKNYIPFTNKRFYVCKPARDFARKLAKRIKDENKDKYDAFKLY